MSLNNVSNRYSDLAGLETTREGRREWLEKAVDAVEEAVATRRELGVQGDLASSLNNVSGQCASLARLETTREGRREWLEKAVDAVEEAGAIHRELGVQGDLAKSLKKLDNPAFVDNAPAAVVDKERGRVTEMQAALKRLEEQLDRVRPLA